MIEAGSHGALLFLDDRPLSTPYGDFRLHRFRNFATRTLALAVVIGDQRSAEPLLARVHSSCVTSEAYDACDCDCAEQLGSALADIGRAGRGVVFYLVQEGRGAGFAAKARDRMIVQASGHRLTTFEAYELMGLGKDHRRYDEVESMRRLLGIVAPLHLLSNNPEKVAALRAEGVPIESVEPLAQRVSPFNVHYIAAKRRSGHSFAESEGSDLAAELPEPIEAFSPVALDDVKGIVKVASYWLPVRAGSSRRAPCWFRLHLYVDAESGSDRVVLVHRRRERALPLVGVVCETLFDRFPARHPSTGRRRWRTAVERIRRAGSGVVLFHSADDAGRGARSSDYRLLARHLPRGRARLLESEDDGALREGLEACGVATLAARTE